MKDKKRRENIIENGGTRITEKGGKRRKRRKNEKQGL